MAAGSSIEVRELPLPQDGMDLVRLLWHKGSPWIEDLRRRLHGKVPGAADHFLVALAAGRPVAVAWYTILETDPSLGLLGHVYTHPEHRRQGISTRLVERAMVQFQSAGGEVLQLFTSTPYTVPWYERWGFENLHAGQAYHETDWYMRYPAGSGVLIDTWYEPFGCGIRPLADGDLPGYCLLYNLEHQTKLKDWAQGVGSGLEAELAFINTRKQTDRAEAACCVLDNGQAIAGIASLVPGAFPHHRHLAAVDFYVHPSFAARTEDLLDACLARREALGVETLYAVCADEGKGDTLTRLGFRPAADLPRHYKIGDRYFDCRVFRR